MKYNRLGKTGLLVSELGLRTWINFAERDERGEQLYDVMKTAFQGGVNYFDCAEAYNDGQAEIDLGKSLKLGLKEKLWKRSDLVLSTKLFFGALPVEGSPEYNQYQRSQNRKGLSRKHIIEGMRESLDRMGIEYIDLVYAHRCDPLVDMEEIVRGFNYLIEQGLAFYWGTSEWTPQQVQEARGIAARLGLIGPSMEQAQYNLLYRERVEVGFKRLYPALGVATWSPLALGILTGKYKDGIPEGSRLAAPNFQKTRKGRLMQMGIDGTEQLRPLAAKLGCSLAQLALAWCMSNKNVSTVIGGASSIDQIKENIKASNYVDKLTPTILAAIDDVFPRPLLSEGERMAYGIRTRNANLRHLNL